MKTLSDRPCRPGGILLIGINPSPVSVACGHYYQGTLGRRLWKRLTRLGLLKDATEGQEDDAFVGQGNGLTDLAKRPTSQADELQPEELASGATVLHEKIKAWSPGLILFAFKPPAEYLLGSGTTSPGRCRDLDGVPTFLLTGPYAAAEDAARVDGELMALLKTAPQPQLGNRDIVPTAPVSAQAEARPFTARAIQLDNETGRTQRVTEIDLSSRRIRLPRPAKKFFPDSRTDVQIDLRGELLTARYDPRTGPDKERSATLVFGKSVAHLVRAEEMLTATSGPDGIVCLR